MSGGDSNRTMPGYIPPALLGMESLHRLLRSGLSRVVEPARIDALLARAAAQTEDGVMPDDPVGMAAMVFGPLRADVQADLGEEAAVGLMRALTPVLLRACRESERTPESLAAADSSAPPADGAPGAAGSADDGSVPPPAPSVGRRGVVLVVHPDVPTRIATSKLLRTARFQTLNAADGNIALAMAMRRKPNFIVAALDMPSVGGLQLAALLGVAFGSDAPALVLLGATPQGPTPGVGAFVAPDTIDGQLIPALAKLTPG